MNRRNFLAVSSSSVLLGAGGCVSDRRSLGSGEATGTDDGGDGTRGSDDDLADREDDEHACTREKWSVVLYNESDSAKTISVTILDNKDQNVFSDTVEIDSNTDQFTGVEPGVEVYYDQSYTFEAALSGGDTVSKETVVNCGKVYIFVAESGEVVIRDDSHRGD